MGEIVVRVEREPWDSESIGLYINGGEVGRYCVADNAVEEAESFAEMLRTVKSTSGTIYVEWRR